MHYLRIFLFGVFAHLLAACGGGSSDDHPAPNELSLTGNEFDQYTGIITGANLHPAIMDLFVSIVLSDSYEFPSDYRNSEYSSVNTSFTVKQSNSDSEISVASHSSETIDVDETELCESGGKRSIKGTINKDLTATLEINYSQCSEGNTTYDGNVTMNIIDGSDSDYEVISYYKKLQISDGNSRTRLSGRQHTKESDYGARVETVSDLVVVDLITEAQIKYEDYKTTSSCFSCTYAENTSFEGRIFHSDFGYLDIMTPEPLYDGRPYTNPGLLGKISFRSSTGKTFLLTFDYKEVYKQSTINHKIYSVRVQFDGDSDGLFEQELVFPFELAFSFQLYDIADSDGDGMTDGWERLFGLNPTIDDSSVDSDMDGYSNLEEFHYGGNPSADYLVPLVSDLSIELTELYDSIRGGRPQTIYVTVNNPNTVYGANDVEIIVTKTSDTQWEDYDRDGWTFLNDNQISLKLEYFSQDSLRTLPINVLGEPGEYSLSARVSSRTTDTNLSNNQHSLNSSFAPRETNVGLIANSYLISDGFSNFDSAAIGHEHSFRILVTNWGPDDAKNTIFRMSLPNHLQVLSASYHLENISSGDCTVSEEILCNLGTFFNNAASYQGHVQIDVKGLSEGVGEYTATIISDSSDPEPGNNQITKEIFVGQSLKPIQDQIDAADGPIEINLSAGMYVGGLNFSNHGVTINGSEGAGETLIRTAPLFNTLPSIFNLGSNTTIRNIRFLGAEARTYSTPAININGENILIENNIFEHNGANVVGIDGWGQNVNISGNIFKNSRTINSLCHVIGVDGPGPYHIANNLIYDTDCTAIMMFKTFNQPSQSSVSTIINNTIINNVAGISDLVMYESHNFKIANNIIVKNKTGLDIRQGNTVFYDDPYSLPVINHNLFFENQVDIQISQFLNLDYYEDGSNLYEDPLFVDENTFNFQLNPESVAIDAGSNTDAPTYDLNKNSRPQDGNADGILQVDIGAYERSN